MKSKKIWLTVLAVALVLGMVGCSNGTTDAPTPPPKPQTTVYSSVDDDGNSYRLEIIEKVSGREVYAPKAGDSYVLTIYFTNGTTNTSSGTVKESGEKLTLQPANNTAVTFTITVSGQDMKTIEGKITFEDNSSKEPPKILKKTPNY